MTIDEKLVDLKCPVRGCEDVCQSEGMFLCKTHWRMVSEATRAEVYRDLLDWGTLRDGSFEQMRAALLLGGSRARALDEVNRQLTSGSVQ